MKRAFPLIAFAIGLAVSLILFGFHPLDADTTRKLPLLTALLMAEFGFLVNAAAVIYGIKQHIASGLTKTGLLLLPLNILLAGYLLLTGFKLWPGIAGG